MILQSSRSSSSPSSSSASSSSCLCRSSSPLPSPPFPSSLVSRAPLRAAVATRALAAGAALAGLLLVGAAATGSTLDGRHSAFPAQGSTGAAAGPAVQADRASRAQGAAQKPPTAAPAETPPRDPAVTSDPQPSAQQAEIEELKRRLELLAAEVERLRSGEEPEQELTDERRRALGLAPSASAAYRRRQGLSFAGYGEMLVENYASADEGGRPVARASQFDFLRLVLYSGYRFTDRFVFNSEIELEHANEISVEFAYVDYLASDALAFRGGMVLIPMGLVNEFHEPTVFLAARRPETETRVLSSTWRENGAGVLGSAGPVSYRAYVVNGLNAAGFSAAGLRGGRQKGSRARAADLALVGRLDVAPTPGVLAGGSLYVGQSDQGQLVVDGRRLGVGTRIFELHGQAQAHGVDLRALYARARLTDVAGLNRALGLSGSQSVGEVQVGGYAQVGYNLLARRAREISLLPFYRFERVDTQARVPAGFAKNPALAATIHTVGVEFKPIVQVVVKADYQIVSNRAGTGLSQFNVSLGYAF